MTKSHRKQPEPKGSYWKAHLGDWAKYTAAAGAALSMATGADAGIVTFDTNLTVTIGESNVGTGKGGYFGVGRATVFNRPSFYLFTGNHSSHRRASARLFDIHLIQSQTFSFGRYGIAKKFSAGQSIDGNIGSVHKNEILRLDDAHLGHKGNFLSNGATAYAGFELTSGTHAGDLGWLKIIVSDRNDDGYVDQMQVLSFAYNDVSGAKITAGQTTDAPAAPEPGTAALGLLGAGAAGIIALRRRRKELQSN